jgi:TetR/AcrR family transcriptional regulator
MSALSEAPQKERPARSAEEAAPEQDAAREARIRDPERTKGNILEAAIEEFSTRGFAGARVDSIASRSGANKRMIYHYFGSKRELWLAVLEVAYERVRTAELGLRLDQLEPEEAMRTLVGFTFDAFIGDRVFINLLNSENLHQARHLKQSKRITSMHSPLIGMIQEILNRGADAGLFRRNIDPAQLWITIAGISFFYFSNIFTLSVILDRDLQSDEGIRERRAHVVEMVMNGIRPLPPR